mmetsp:Transcript_41855/g.55174  ORF Transcript_41855/g.55174 Transcript_41855/m.55174 type:complete len:95 (+) Transcript_41855:208-492(+)
MIDRKYPDVMAKREREFNELQAKRQAEKRAREEQKNQAIPVLYSNAQIFKGMKASVNITNSQRHVCKVSGHHFDTSLTSDVFGLAEIDSQQRDG